MDKPVSSAFESGTPDGRQANPYGEALGAPSVPRAAAQQVALVLNPTSGNHCPDKLDRLCRSFSKERYTVNRYDSQSFKLEELALDVDLVCISGGDGTLRTVIGNNKESGRQARYCVFPTGTINLVAREAGYRARLQSFVPDVIGRCGSRKHIVGRIGDEVFLCCASIGPDSRAVAQVTPALKKRLGRFAYVVGMAQIVWHWPRHRLQLDIDGARHEAEAVFLLKSRYYAGPWVLDDRASLTSDRLRVLLMPRARRRDFARLALFALLGPTFADRRWTRMDAQSVDVSGPADMPIQADGDIVARTPARVTVDPDPLNFL